MLSRAVAVAVACVTACYSPSATPGAPCGTNDVCPAGQECRAGWCFPIGTPHDSSLDPDGDLDSTLLVVDARPDGTPYVPWGTPQVLPSLETTDNGETDPTLSTNRLVVAIVATNATNLEEIYIGTRATTADPFTTTIATVLNTTAADKGVELTGDGKTLYFCSNITGNYDVYSSTETGGVWSAPAPVPSLSTAGDDEDPALTPDGLTSVVMIDAATNTFAFRTRANTAQAFGSMTTHPELHITADIASPTITNNADTIYFHAGASRDIYVSHKMANGNYETPVPVAELNTAMARDAAPFINQADNYMIFEKAGDIYITTR